MAAVSKKRKTVDDRLLKDFWKKEKWQCLLKSLAQDLFTGHWSASATVLKIDQADAHMYKFFSNAFCQVSNHVFPDGSGVAESFGNLFSSGINILLDYLNDGTLPKDEQQRYAFWRLTAFLESDFDWLENTDEDNEKNWCIKIAEHFLSELSPSKSYIVANSFPYSDVSFGTKGRTEEYCPCNKHEKLHGEFGDTSFGVPSLWHGEADLLYRIPVMFANGGGDEPDSVSESASSTETEGKNFSQQDKYQMRAQVISFAYTMRNKDKEEIGESAQNYLVPHIGFSKEKFCLHFYDCVNDILLTTRCFDLFQKLNKKINYSVAVLAWLALNYKVLGGNTPDRLLEFKSGFHEMFIPKVIKKYNDEAQLPCHGKPFLQAENVDCELPVFWPQQGTDDNT